MIKLKPVKDISAKHRDPFSFLHCRGLKDSWHCDREWELLLEFQVWIWWNHHLFSFLIIHGGFTELSLDELSVLFCLPGVWQWCKQRFLIRGVPPCLTWSLLKTDAFSSALGLLHLLWWCWDAVPGENWKWMWHLWVIICNIPLWSLMVLNSHDFLFLMILCWPEVTPWPVSWDGSWVYLLPVILSPQGGWTRLLHVMVKVFKRVSPGARVYINLLLYHIHWCFFGQSKSFALLESVWKENAQGLDTGRHDPSGSLL